MGKTLIILLIIVLLLFLIIVAFSNALVKDLLELKAKPLPEKFQSLIDGINNGLFNDEAEVVTFPKDPRTVNLFCEKRPNMIVTFFYSTGKMNVTLGYKFLQEEMKFEETMPDMRDASSLQQKDNANIFVENALEKINEHQKKVAGYEPSTEVVDDTYNEKAPLSMQASLYASMSKNQKMSYINLLYVIAKADGSSDVDASNEIVILEDLRVMNLKWSECHDYYLKNGSSQIIKDLACNNIDSSAMDVMIFSSFVITNGNESRENKMVELFQQIGVSEGHIEQTVSKISALYKMFS